MADSAFRKRFRIALSFTGEKREFIAKVADILAQRFSKKSILYDKYHEAEFARHDLGFYLQNLYNEQSELIVVLICRDYSQKEWPGLEWSAIFDLIKRRKSSSIMLCRFDHATAPGLFGTAGFVDLDGRTPEQTAEQIAERLAINEEESKGCQSSSRYNTEATSINQHPAPTRLGHVVVTSDFSLVGDSHMLDIALDEVLSSTRTSQPVQASVKILGYSDLHDELLSLEARGINSDEDRVTAFKLRERLKVYTSKTFDSQSERILSEVIELVTRYIHPQLGDLKCATNCVRQCFSLLAHRSQPKSADSKFQFWHKNIDTYFSIYLSPTETNALMAREGVHDKGRLTRDWGLIVLDFREHFEDKILPRMICEFLSLEHAKRLHVEPEQYFDLRLWKAGLD